MNLIVPLEIRPQKEYFSNLKKKKKEIVIRNKEAKIFKSGIIIVARDLLLNKKNYYEKRSN